MSEHINVPEIFGSDVFTEATMQQRLAPQVYEAWKNHPIFRGVMSGLKPAVIGLIGTAAVTLATPENFIDWKSFVICAVAFIALYFKKVGPFAIIGLGAIVGLLVY